MFLVETSLAYGMLSKVFERNKESKWGKPFN